LCACSRSAIRKIFRLVPSINLLKNTRNTAASSDPLYRYSGKFE
jgi:hypothetical protein